MREIVVEGTIFIFTALAVLFLVVFFVFLEPDPLILLLFWWVFALRSMVFLVIIAKTEVARLKFRFEAETFIFIAVGIQGFLIYISGDSFRSFEMFLGTLYLVGVANVMFKEYFLARFSAIGS